MQVTLSEMIQFQQKILSWYDTHQRDLPWRQSRDPYRILVSEIMLQQTQVPRVIQKYTEWLVRFPTITTLAKSTTADVLRYWSGLGYNRRALYLKKIAEIIMRQHKGVFPQTEEALLQLPGIGKYTARAILCFAFDKQVAVVDTNVKKVFIVEFLRKESSALQLSDSPVTVDIISDKVAWEIAERMLPYGKAYEWNQALMDYSSAVLKKEKIAIPKQPQFKNSNRYFRGEIVRLLLAKKEISIIDLGKRIKDSYTSEDRLWLMGLLEQMEKESFLIIEKGNVRLV